jgi:hypothetical protein
VVGARVEVCADDLGDVLGAALRDDRVEQAVGAAVGEVVLPEAEVQLAPSAERPAATQSVLPSSGATKPSSEMDRPARTP